MKEKLELKQLSPYLPYGFKGVDYFQEHKLIRDINCNNVMALVDGDTNLKPILRPLSDLTKEIEHNAEKFIPFHRLKSIYGNDLTIDYKYNITFEDGVEASESYCYQVDLLDCYELYQHLFSWHFDVFGLIDKGLAIDINTTK